MSAAVGQAVTGGKPQHQHSGQRQRSQPQEQAAGEQSYFFLLSGFPRCVLFLLIILGFMAGRRVGRKARAPGWADGLPGR